jgi:ABC-type multidrug transport system permease subunit
MQVRGSGSNSSSNKASSPDDDQVTGPSTLAAACVMCSCCFLCVHVYLNLATPSYCGRRLNGDLYFLVLVANARFFVVWLLCREWVNAGWLGSQLEYAVPM